MGIRIYSNSFSNPEYYSYSYSLKVDSTNNIRIRIRVKIIIRDNTDPYTFYTDIKLYRHFHLHCRQSTGTFTPRGIK